MDILMPALFGLQCVLGPPDVIPNLALIETLAESNAVDIWSMVPSLVDELGETPVILEKFRSSKFICASGGKYTLFNLRQNFANVTQDRSIESVPAR